ncbi:MAG: Rid family detoxifying hydrolase [Bacillota bacterium]|nr:Rid family detoxifying hydrolase [Bacillota bacterium]
MIKKINISNSKLAGPYSPAIQVNELLFVSGQIPILFETGHIVGNNIVEQTEQVIANIKTVLKEAGSDISKVIKTTCFLKNMSDFPEFNEIYAKHFTSSPARSCVEVSAIPKGALVEIELIAQTGQ